MTKLIMWEKLQILQHSSSTLTKLSVCLSEQPTVSFKYMSSLHSDQSCCYNINYYNYYYNSGDH